MNTIHNDNLESGVRAIYRAALLRIGVKMKRETPTEELIRAVHFWGAPLDDTIDEWITNVYGNKQTQGSDKALKLCQDIARRAWGLCEVEREKTND